MLKNTNITKTVVQTTVFADGPGGGNPCPVVLDANELSPGQGMWLAARFAAETILVGSPTRPEASFALRYFVPLHEMEMCVHGTIAAVTVLHTLGKIATSPVQIETILGLISVEWTEQNEKIIVTVNQFAPEFSKRNPSVPEIAEALQLPETSSIRADLPIVSVSTSRPKLIVPLGSVQELDGLRPDFGALWLLCDRYRTTGVYPFSSVRTKDNGIYAARQFPKRAGYNEDPATGVAACALASYLTQYQTKKEGWNSFEILQGHAMGRPSRLTAKALSQDGSVRETKVTGTADILNRESVPIVF
jgi:PhzF family phenazine biosynthesis protein